MIWMIPKDVYNLLIALCTGQINSTKRNCGCQDSKIIFLFQATHLGLQRKILAELSKPQSLVAPQELYQFVLLSGLASGPQLEPSLLQQRRCLLNVALEHSLGMKWNSC